MNLATLYSRTNEGINAPLVTIETHISNGLPGFSIVGLPDMAVRESKDRVRAAILNSGFDFPAKRITVNLAPADIPKDGGRFDLPIALGILAASGQVKQELLNTYEFIGELSLGGALRTVHGVLPTAHACQQVERGLFIPADNADEASLIQPLTIHAASHLLQVTAHLNQLETLTPFQKDISTSARQYKIDMSDIKGQFQARRALEIAAAGGHNMLMVGPPGTGKTMLANRLPTILPDMTQKEALETAAITSISNQSFNIKTWAQRPVREPHHTASAVALVGGGSKVVPGEISLAHNGILFLDELTEFDRKVLDALREPLENNTISISRAMRSATFPARFMLIAAYNPCPTGKSCDLRHNCSCSLQQREKHRNKLSAPFLDRIDIQVTVPRLSQKDLQTQQTGENSEAIRQRVIAAQQRQLQRQTKLNRYLTNKEIEAHCTISKESEQLLAQAMEKFELSARAYHRILKVARTIADINHENNISEKHLAEAIGYRMIH